MKISYGADHEFVPASHENPLDPGVWKKVLFPKADLQAGVVQMVNWARLGAGKHFAAHYHEDMQEIFIILQGEAHLTAGTQTVVLRRGDAVRIDPRKYIGCPIQGPKMSSTWSSASPAAWVDARWSSSRNSRGRRSEAEGGPVFAGVCSVGRPTADR